MNDLERLGNLAHNAIFNFDQKTGSKRTPEQLAATQHAIMSILSEIKPDGMTDEAHAALRRAVK